MIGEAQKTVSRINQAKNAFSNKKKDLLTSKRITLKTRMKFSNPYIWRVALYGNES